jgi:serine/threonine protein phosphatase 1
MHYVIGDVHGHYSTLKTLAEKLPDDAGLIFVGDLIDRGPQSADVIRFVRQYGHRCVMGNHEALMMTYGSEFISACRQRQALSQNNLWYVNGGIHTLLSYGVAVVKEGRLEKEAGSGKELERLEDDLRWMQTLPYYIELDIAHVSGIPVKGGPDVQPHYVNIDTGCYREKVGYHRLSAYCVETGAVVSVECRG